MAFGAAWDDATATKGRVDGELSQVPESQGLTGWQGDASSAILEIYHSYLNGNRMSNLRSRVLESLRSDIFDGRIRSGEILLERELAARFEVSKTPVREALALLCETGLVQLFPRRGYVVRAIGVQEVLETFDLRLILEPAAAERAARNLTGQEIAQLEVLLAHDYCGDPDAMLSNRLEAMRHSFEFHVLIARGSGNQKLEDKIEKLLRESRRITSIGFVFGEHAGIVEALKSRDGGRARQVMEDHVLSGRAAAMQALAGWSVDGSPDAKRRADPPPSQARQS